MPETGSDDRQTYKQVCLQATAYFSSGRLAEATTACRLAIDIDPNSPEAYAIQGDICQAQQQFDEAIAAYSQALQFQPNDDLVAKVSSNLGDALYNVNRRLEALSQYEKAIVLQPDAVRANWMLGCIAEEQGWIEIALQYYRKAMTLDPAFFTPQSHVSVGKLLQERNFYTEAANFFNTALRLQPDYADAYHAMGNLLLAQGDVEAASQLYDRAEMVEIDLITAKQYNDLGVACINQNKLDLAIAHFQKAIQIKPDYADAHCNLGNTFLQQHNLRDAIICYQEALNIDPNFEEVYYNLGTSLAELNRLDEAIAFLHAAITVNPNFADAHYNLASALVKMNERDLALMAYQRAIDLRPDLVQTHSNLGFDL
ncbi:tetratricopeptide repeat protein [Pseudanabaena sp. PCC 6802]|uniref:tetratricopeptide repeat protein n=1 Tax=Pseudanabaena sp. PCC 6802 TaxID=118173 RepID=UPI000348D1EE|nr:tetratricopeptide repeat protein [Pseudanabaena sp. PCC 6802]